MQGGTKYSVTSSIYFYIFKNQCLQSMEGVRKPLTGEQLIKG